LKNNFLLIALFSFLLLNKANSQLLPNPFFNPKDTVFIGYIEGRYFLYHIVKKEENLGSIALKYGTTVAALKDINGMTGNQLIEKKIIKIPVQYEHIKSPGKVRPFEKNNYVPIFYKVKKGDTLYRLFRIYFPRDSAEINKINLIKSNIIKIDSKLLIGYFPMQSIKNASTDIVFQPNINKDTLSLNVDNSKIILVSVSGAAQTFDSPIEKTPYSFVLSNKIPEESVVEITNPMSKKRLTGKVIGKIPPGKYPLDILLLISKKDDLDLGFLDLKFFVSVKYYK
jgi:LysM repeat protein